MLQSDPTKGPVYWQMLFTSHHVIVARPSSAQQLHAAVCTSTVMQGWCMPQLACHLPTRRRCVGMRSSPWEQQVPEGNALRSGVLLHVCGRCGGSGCAGWHVVR